MPDEPTLEQEIEQAVEESFTEDAKENSEEVEGTPEKVEDFPSEGSTGEVVVPEGEKETPEDTQKVIQGDTLADADASGSQGDTPEDSEEDTKEVNSTEISPETLASAVNSGLTLEQARSFKSEEALSQFNGRVQYERNQQAEQQWSQQQAQVQQQQQEQVDPFADLPKLDSEDYDAGVVEMFERLTGIARDQQEQIAAFQGQQEQATAQAHQAGQREVENWFDSKVKALGDKFEVQLGKGAYSVMDKSSQQAMNRDAIADHMSILIAGYRHHGMAEPDRSVIFETASKAVLADRYAELATEKFTKDVEAQSTQTINRVNKTNLKRTLTSEEEDAALGAEIDSKFS